MKRIKAVQVGRKRYRVRYAPLAHDYGRVTPFGAKIILDKCQTDAELADTLIHEVLHAIWASAALPSRVAEERAVTHLARGLAAVARDNPGLFGHIESLAQGPK